MKVARSGRRRHRRDDGLLSGQGRPRGDGHRPPARRGAGDELRQCRRNLARLCLALGRPRRAGQGDQVAVDAARPAGGAAASSIPRCGDWMSQMLRNCTSARYAINKARMVPHRRIQPRRLRALRGETGIAYDERSQGTLQLFRKQKQLDRIGERHRGAQALRRAASRCSTATAASRPSRRLAHVAGKFVGGLRLPDDETGDCQLFTSALAAIARAARRSFPLRHDDRAARDRRRSRRAALSPIAGTSHGRRLCRGARQLFAAAAAAARHRMPVYPVKGYSITVPVIDEARRAGVDRDGRDLQGRRSRGSATASASAARPRSRGYRRSAARTAAQHAGAFADATCFPSGGDFKRGNLLERSAPDDAGWHADHRPDAIRQPLSQHRSRHARLDHGVWGWARDDGPVASARGGDIDRRAYARSLRSG